MPRLPTYEPSVSLPTNVRTPDFGQKNGLGQLGRKVGKVLQIRGEQLTREYDTVKAVSAYNTFSNSSRVQVGEYLKLERAAAAGIQDSYKEWVVKESADTSKQLSSRPQQDMYNNMVAKRREADLNVLARYENLEWRKNQQDTFEKHIVETESAIRAATVAGLNSSLAGDDIKFIDADGMLEDLLEKTHVLYPHRDLTVKQAEITQAMRSVMLQEMADRDPALAGKYLKTYKKQLGEAYFSLKKMIQGKVSDSRLGAALIKLMGDNGDNYEKSMGLVNNPSKWDNLNIDYDIANQLDSRLSGLMSERNRRTNEVRRLADLRLEEGNETATIDYYSDNPVNLLQLLKERKIDSATYEHLTKQQAEGVMVENPFTKSDLEVNILRGTEDFKDQLKFALHNGHIKGATYTAYLKQYNNEKYKAASSYIARALKPSEADKWSEDKHVKYADAMDLFKAKISNGADYDLASKEVVSQYISEMNRSVEGLSKPKYLKGSKDDIDALETAKYDTAMAFHDNLIGIEEYKREIQTIENLQKVLRENQAMIEMDADLEAARKKRR